MARSRELYDLLKLSSLGLEMGIAVVLGLLAGSYLDRKLGTGPWLTVFFTLCGFAAAGKAIFRAVKDSAAMDEADDRDGQPGDDDGSTDQHP